MNIDLCKTGLLLSFFFLCQVSSLPGQPLAFFYGTPDITEAGTKVAVDPEGNFLLTGQRFSFVDPGGSVPTNSDASVLKIDPLGALLWSNHIDSTITDAAVSVIPRSANNQVVLARSCEALVSGVGCGQNNVRLYFLTNGGNVSNISDHYLGSNALPANFVATPDGGFLICGVTNTYSANSDIFVIKTNAVGEQEWEAIIPGTAPRAFDLVLANDGGCYVAGSSVESAGRVTLFSRISAEGSVQWVKYFGEAGFTGKMARIGSHFGLLLTNAPTDFYGIELYLLDTEGEVVWEKDLAGTMSRPTCLTGVDNGLVVGGLVETPSPNNKTARFAKYDFDGNLLWGRTHDPFPDFYERPTDIIPLPNGGLAVGGNTELPDSVAWVYPADLMLLLLDKEGQIDSVMINRIEEPATLPVHVFPNPAQDRVVFDLTGIEGAVRLQFLNAQGQLVGEHPISGHRPDISLAAYPNGWYWFQIHSARGRLLGSGKLLLQR